MNRYKVINYSILFSMALFVSIMSHMGMIWLATEGKLFVGFGDGLSQMLTFKQYLFEQYQQGNWAYAQGMGFGGGLFATLNYYYSTNLFVLLWFFLLSIFSIQPTVETWAYLLIPMSIAKQMLIFTVAFYYLKLFFKERRGAFVGALVYMMSPFFFKNQINTDILADIALYIPFLLIGIEWIIRKRSPLFFVIALTLTLINNFYIAFIVCLIGFLYILLRFIIRLSHNEKTRVAQLKTYIWTSILSFGMSSFIFIPAAISYLDNERPPYTDPIKWFELRDNLLVDESRVLWLPAIVMVILTMRPFYKHKTFLLFAAISVLGTIGYYSPLIGSIFNGLSAPNNRWVPIVTLSYGGLIAFMFAHANEARRKDWLISIGLALIGITLATGIGGPDFHNPLTWLAYIWVLFMLLFAFSHFRPQLVSVVTIVALLLYSNYFLLGLSTTSNMKGSTLEYVQGNALAMSDDVKEAAAYMKENSADENVRYDWSDLFRENTPYLVGLNGFSTYSSISNGNIMYMYWRDLQIDPGRESLSRYRTLGDRTNLMALFQAQYYMRDKTHRNLPYGVEKVGNYGDYRLYENPYRLPAFRVTDRFYNQQQLAALPVLTREHAMLEGVITEDGKATMLPAKALPYTMTIKNAQLEKNKLVVKKEAKPAKLTFTLKDLPKDAQTIYVQFYLQADKVKNLVEIKVNDLATNRKRGTQKYATGFNYVTLAIPAEKKVTIKIPKGQYVFKDAQFFPETYKTLENAITKYQANDMVWENDTAKGHVTAEQENSMLVTPIPFEKGWKATVNGEEVPLEKVNYAFIGLPLDQGQNEVVLQYAPPYWRIVVSLSIASLLLTIFIFYRRKKSLKRWSSN